MSDDRPDLSLDRLTRRRFLGAGALSAVASVLPGCGDPPPEYIVPYVERPLEVTPGVSRYYATAALRDGIAIGILAASRDGRPIKIEGNPDHPSSLGATGPVEQALSYTLYDTDRLRSIQRGNAPASFDALSRALQGAKALHLFLPATSSPLVETLLGRLTELRSDTQVHFDPSGLPTSEWSATRQVFGRVLAPQYRFDIADRVLTLDADILSCEPGSLHWSRQWATRRTADAAMTRCYAVDPTPTGTSAAFDHRLAVRASEVGRIAAGLLGALDPAHAVWLHRTPHRQWIEAVARDLAQHRGRTLVVAGPAQPAHVHVLSFAINAVLGSFGNTIAFTRSPWIQAGERSFDPQPLFDALDAGAVETLFIGGTNPAYTINGFEEWARRARERVVLSLYPTETTRIATWRVPELHILERWGDARGHDGTWTLVQPLIRPLFGGVALERLLLAMVGEREEVRQRLVSSLAESGHDLRSVLARGFVEGSAFPIESVEPSLEAVPRALAELDRDPGFAEQAFELVVRPDPRLGYGAHAENAWLQELPETMSKLVWDNAALMAPADAAAFGLRTGDVIEVVTPAGTVRLPVQPIAGHARHTVVVWRGFGRREGGRSARGVGVDVGPVAIAPWIRALVKKTDQHYRLAHTQHHFELPPDEVPVALWTNLGRFQANPTFAERHDETPPSLHPDRLRGRPQWAMAIDLSLCIGCQSCVVACQVENNVPIVGKAQVALGREMHWLRIDRYVKEEGGESRTVLQPMACVHCEKAPCEYVCPVNATVHSPDGLNEMVYNRCIGTRFCSNNCPYKVRRFNWYDFHANEEQPQTLKYNPDVTVRARGVMEKCTYCVQRIRRAGIDARRERRELEDDDVVPACAQACPTDAIVFGDKSARRSKVSRRLSDKRAYGVLNNLGTRPRTRYLVRVDNPNPELETS